MGHRLRDTISLKDFLITYVPFETTTQGDVSRAVGNRRYFLKDEIETLKEKIFVESYKRLNPPIVVRGEGETVDAEQ